MNDDQFVSFGNLERCFDRQTVGGSVYHPAARHERRGLGEPGRIPERTDLALRLVARARAAIEAVERRGLQEQRFHGWLLRLGTCRVEWLHGFASWFVTRARPDAA